MRKIPRMVLSPLRRGFSLMELLVTISIIAILAAIITPNFISSQKRAQDDNAVARAAGLDLAKASFLQELGPKAVQAWNIAEAFGPHPENPAGDEDQQKYELLKPYLNAPPNSLGYGTAKGQYAPYGYRLFLGDLTGPTAVTRLSDNESIGAAGSSGVIVYKLVVNRSPVAGGTVSGGGTYNKGTIAQLTAVSAMGYRFKEWTGAVSSTDETVDVTMDSDKSVTAVFESAGAESYTVNITTNSSNGGQVRIDGGAWGKTASKSVSKGDMVTIQAQGINGYQFIGWTGASGSSPSRSFTVDKNYNIMANFKPPSYTMNISADSGGSASPSGSFSQPGGSSLRITAVANSGYEFDRWVVNGSSYSSSTYSATVSGNITAVAKFKTAVVPNYQLSISKSDGGTAEIVGTSSGNPAPSGSSFTVKAVPNENYKFLFWSFISGTGTLGDAGATSTTVTIGSNDVIVKPYFLYIPPSAPQPPPAISPTSFLIKVKASVNNIPFWGHSASFSISPSRMSIIKNGTGLISYNGSYPYHCHWVAYPYKWTLKLSKSGSFSATLPNGSSTQVYGGAYYQPIINVNGLVSLYNVRSDGTINLTVGVLFYMNMNISI